MKIRKLRIKKFCNIWHGDVVHAGSILDYLVIGTSVLRF